MTWEEAKVEDGYTVLALIEELHPYEFPEKHRPNV